MKHCLHTHVHGAESGSPNVSRVDQNMNAIKILRWYKWRRFGVQRTE